MKDISRREFFSAAAGFGAAILVGCGKEEASHAGGVKPKASKFDAGTIAVASGNDPGKNARAAVDALGGIAKLVRKGDFVVIKPNMAWNRPPEMAATTNPKASKFDAGTIAVASGNDPGKNARAVVDALGGIAKLVRKGDFVVIKPNMAWNRPPEMAATTNPKVVAELVKMCKEAGAGRILVIDNIIDKPAEGVMGLTGIRQAGQAAGAEVKVASNESDFRKVDIPKGKAIKSDTCIKEILKADVFINVPIAKVHSGTGLTLSMKNLMGCIWDRQTWHQTNLDQCIADYATAVRPDLIVLDATRILLTNGPKGPGETKDVKKVIAGTDPVAVDAYGATLLGRDASKTGHIRMAYELGVGEIDLKKIKVKQV